MDALLLAVILSFTWGLLSDYSANKWISSILTPDITDKSLNHHFLYYTKLVYLHFIVGEKDWPSPASILFPLDWMRELTKPYPQMSNYGYITQLSI